LERENVSTGLAIGMLRSRPCPNVLFGASRPCVDVDGLAGSFSYNILLSNLRVASFPSPKGGTLAAVGVLVELHGSAHVVLSISSAFAHGCGSCSVLCMCSFWEKKQ
jgi:hypothetical protein